MVISEADMAKFAAAGLAASHDYDDIIDLPYPPVETDSPQLRELRASQYLPFAAMPGPESVASPESAAEAEPEPEISEEAAMIGSR